MSYKKDPLYKQFLAEEQAKDTPQVQSQPQQQAYEQDPLYQKFLEEETKNERLNKNYTPQEQKKIKSKAFDTGNDTANDFLYGAGKNFLDYGASLYKGIGKASDAMGFDGISKKAYQAQKKLRVGSERADYNIGNKYVGMAGEMLSDPLNLTPAGIFTKGTKALRIAKSVAGGVGVGAGTMALKNYGNDTLTQQDKNLDMSIGAGFVGTLNGIIAGITKGRVSNAIDADLFAGKDGKEISDAIMSNPKGFGLSDKEAKDVVLEAEAKYPKVPDEFKVEQAGVQQAQEPNFRQVPQYPPMSQEQALDVLAKEANRKRMERGEAPIYPEVQPEFKTENVYPQQPEQPYTPDYVSGDFNNNIPTPYNEAGNLEARYQKVASHPRLQELLQARENVLAKDSVSPTRNTDNGYFAHENNGNGYETTKIPPNRERNYNSDFQLTKQDIYKLYTGKVDDDLISKLETDLGTLDNHPDYAKSFNSESGIDYKSELEKLDNTDVKMSDANWEEANSVFSKGIDNVAVGTYAGVDEDENGNLTFNPEKFVLGLGGYTAVKQAIKNGKVRGLLKSQAQRAIDAVDFTPQVQKRNGINGAIAENTYNDTANIHNIDTTPAPPELVKKATEGDDEAYDALANAVFSRTFEQVIGKNTGDDLKPMILDKLVKNPNIVEELAEKMGYNIEYFSANPENVGRNIGNKKVIKQPSAKKLKKDGYAKGNIFVYDPYDIHGAFNDAEYTKAWRGVHELAHAITEKLMQGRYGDSRRFGAMSFDRKNPYNPNDKRSYKALTLENAQRAVEWEDVAFRTQLKLLDELGIKVDANQAINDFNIAGSDTLLRAITGDFSDPAKYGVLPRTDNKRIDVKDALQFLENQEIENAKFNGVEPTMGVDLSKWSPISDDELNIVLSDAKDMPLGKGYSDKDGLQFSVETVAGEEIDNDLKTMIQRLPKETQEQYHKDMYEALTTNTGENIIAKKLGLETSGFNSLSGVWKGEVNPSTQLNIKPKFDEAGNLSKDFVERVDDMAEMFAIAYKQDGVGWHYPEFVDGKDINKVNGIDVRIGKQLNEKQALQIEHILSSSKLKDKFFIASTEDGFRIIQDGAGLTGKEFTSIVKKQLEKLQVDYEIHGFSSKNGFQSGVKNGSNIQNSTRRRPDLQEWFNNVVTKRVERVNQRYTKIAERHGESKSIPSTSGNSKLYRDTELLKNKTGNALPLPANKDLILQHNLSEQNLHNADKNGGLAVPSLAITKKDNPIDGFGEISLLGNDELAKPKKDNKVFGADIYSPRYPQIKKDLKIADQRRIENDLSKYDFFGREDVDIDNISNDIKMKIKFLDSKSIEPKIEYGKNQKPDLYGTRMSVESQLKDYKDEYNNFVNDYLSENGAVEKIYNGTDNQGRQKWQAHTLDNVVKKLKKNLRGGENFNYGTGSMRAKLAPEFKTLKKIRDEKDRLVSKDDFAKVKDEIEKKVDELSENLKEYYEYDTNSYGYLDEVMSAISDQDLAGYGFKNIPKNVKDEFDNLTTALKEMPTEYFESKVLRAMDIGEFSHAVIPKNASKETRDILEKKGIEVTEYDPNLPNDRVAKIKQTAEKNGYLFANAGHNMAGGFAGGADSLINQRDYNGDGKYDYKDLLAGVVAGTVSINALKKLAPKLFEDGSKGGVKAGLFAGSKAKGFDTKAQAGKTFDGRYDTLERFEIDDSKAKIKATAKELNKAKNERLSQEKDAIVEQYESGAIPIDEAKKLADDILNKYNHTNSGTFRLDDVLDHKELFDNYPKASEMKVTFTDMPKGANGYFDNQANEIVLNTNMSYDEIKSSLLHELQHSIQKKEGFARGGSAQEFYNDAKKKIDLLKYELEFEPDEFIQDKMMAKLQKLEDAYKNKGKEEAFDMYQKLAGEIEARDVQARADLTAKQREEIAPYSSEDIAPEDANVIFNNADDELVKNMSEDKQSFKDKAKEAKAKGYEHIIKLVDKETKKEWGDATSTLKRLFTDTLGAKYHELRENATSSTNGMSVKLERLHNVLNELSDTDKTNMHNYIVGEDANIPDTLKPLANNIKKSIDDLSKQLVDLGVLSKEQYDEWAGHYIHRNYEKHFFQDVKGLMKKGFKIDEIHKRGKIEEISATQANKLLINPSFIASTKKAMKDGGQRLTKLANGKYELRRDWTKEEREAMGEITDISISAPETLMRLKRMVDNANFMKNIEGIDDVVLKDTGNLSDEELLAQGFAKVPNNPKYGVLSGKTIRNDVLDDLSARNDELFNTFHGKDGALGRIWKNYLSLWKKSKTVWNVPSHINNFMSNTFLMHLSGMRADEVVTAVGKAGKMMVQGNKYEEILKKQMLGKATKSELSELAEMGENLKYFIEAKEGGLLGRSQLNDILQGNQKQVRTTALGKLDKFTEDAYHNGDAINRIAMYSHIRSKLDMSEDEARKAVLTIMPDYSKPMPKGYRVLRDTGISPFISWSYYTMPAVVKMLGTKQGAKKATLAMGTLAGLEYALTGGDVTPMDNIPLIDTNKPEDFKGRRFGVSSKNGKVTTIKTDRWIPYVELLNPVNFLISNVSGVTSNAVVNILTASSAGGMINPYYGRPITYKNKKTSDKAYDYFKYLSKSYVPLPAQAYSGWDLVDSLARSTKKRKTNKVTVPRSANQNILKQLGLNSLSYSKSGLKKEQNE